MRVSARTKPPSPTLFEQRCYEALCQVPKGRVTTYALLAHAVGSRAVRAVGNAMHKNPHAPRVPCHRVVRSDGTLGGYALGLKKKVEILGREGVKVISGRIANLDRLLFAPRKVADYSKRNHKSR